MLNSYFTGDSLISLISLCHIMVEEECERISIQSEDVVLSEGYRRLIHELEAALNFMPLKESTCLACSMAAYCLALCCHIMQPQIASSLVHDKKPRWRQVEKQELSRVLDKGQRQNQAFIVWNGPLIPFYYDYRYN